MLVVFIPWPVVIALTLAPGSSVQGDSEGGPLLSKLEESVAKAESLRIQYSIVVKVSGQEEPFLSQKGTLWQSRGNKVRLDVDGASRGQPKSALVVSDGSQVRALRATPAPTRSVRETHEKLGECIGITFCRAGMYMAQIYLPGAGNRTTERVENDVRSVFKATSIRKVGTEDLEGTNTNKLAWDLSISGNPGKYKITLWLDARTHMPAKRVLVGEMRGRTFTVEEIYTTAELNTKLDPGLFKLPD